MKTKRALSRACLAVVTAGALAITATGTASAAEKVSAESVYTAGVEFTSSAAAPAISEAQILAAFKALEEIPDSVLQAGDAATQSWLKSQLGDGSPADLGGVTTLGVVGCVSAIGLAIVTNLPVFKITKIRTALKAAGGATTFVKNFKRVYDAQRKAKASFSTAVSRGVKEAAKAAGPEAQQLLIELFNLGSVYSACFE